MAVFRPRERGGGRAGAAHGSGRGGRAGGPRGAASGAGAGRAAGEAALLSHGASWRGARPARCAGRPGRGGPRSGAPQDWPRLLPLGQQLPLRPGCRFGRLGSAAGAQARRARGGRSRRHYRARCRHTRAGGAGRAQPRSAPSGGAALLTLPLTPPLTPLPFPRRHSMAAQGEPQVQFKVREWFAALLAGFFSFFY